MIVAIDGPAGAGKSTVARALAERLRARYLDSGAMYRAVALAAIEQPRRTPAELAATLSIDPGPPVLLDGRDVTSAIRGPDVSARASEVAADPAVRSALVAQQRRLLALGDWVAEGRDIGTVVAPGAELKVFLTASPQARAARRADEPAAAIAARDARDSSRAASPLRPAADAVVLDTTELTLAQVVERLATMAGERGPR
ncbi:MAG TPA: (d)CMP kinase [Solirubrobacteraceae bacterium]|nr:(d)CMP kinase [Solirubrobacteraceae bacterium]